MGWVGHPGAAGSRPTGALRLVWSQVGSRWVPVWFRIGSRLPSSQIVAKLFLRLVPDWTPGWFENVLPGSQVGLAHAKRWGNLATLVSKCRQKVVEGLWNCCQKVVNWLSRCCQMVVEMLSKRLSRWSKFCLHVVDVVEILSSDRPGPGEARAVPRDLDGLRGPGAQSPGRKGAGRCGRQAPACFRSVVETHPQISPWPLLQLFSS